MSSLWTDPRALSVIAVAISILALGINALTLIVNYQNQVERRHGDIVRIRSESRMKLSAIQNRLFLIKWYVADTRRALPHATEKDFIKDIAMDILRISENTIEDTREQIAKFNEYFEQIDSMKANKASVMLNIQLLEQQIRTLDYNTNILEQKTMELFNTVRPKQEAIDEGATKE